MIVRLVAATAFAAVLASCSVLLDTTGYVGTAPEDAAIDGAVDASTSDVTSGGTENCTNGIDDDQDGLVDCADPKCQSIGYACSAVPEGWRGPYAVTSGSSPPPCAAPFETPGLEANDELQAPPATCNCECGPVTGTTCSTTMSVSSGNMCASPSNVTVTLACRELSLPAGNAGVASTGVSGSGGTCKPSATQAPVTWGRTVRACGVSSELPSGGCTGTARCAPPTPPGFAPDHCIVHEGDVACHADYPNKRVAFLGVDDARDCPCTCKSPACPTSITAFTGSGCTGSRYNGGSTTCGIVPQLRSARIGNGGALECTPQAGTPSGTAAPSLPFTVCCSG